MLVPGGLPTEVVQAKQTNGNTTVMHTCGLKDERCTLRRITPGEWSVVVVQAREQTPARAVTVVAGNNQVSLERAATTPLLVRVLDETGVVVGASVWFVPPGEREVDPHTRALRHLGVANDNLAGKTDARGELTLSLVVGKATALTASASGYQDPTPLQVQSTDSSVTLRLSRVLRFSGRVVREDGAAVGTFSVDGTEVEASDGRFTRTSALTGNGGTQTITIEAPGLVPVTRAVELAGADVDLGDIVMVRGRSLRGRVLDATTGQSLDGAQVFGGGSTHTRTDALGQFELAEQPAGAVELVAHARDHASASTTCAAGEKADVIVRLSRGVSVSGRVTRPGLDKYVVAIGRSIELAKLEDGSFHFDTLAPGRWSFVLTPFDAEAHVLEGLPLERQPAFAQSILSRPLPTPLDLGQVPVTGLELR